MKKEYEKIINQTTDEILEEIDREDIPTLEEIENNIKKMESKKGD